MIIVDTAVWSAWFTNRRSPHQARLAVALVAGEDVGIVPVILTEVLQGIRSDTGFARMHKLMVRLPLLLLDADGHVDAARLFRKLRGKGVTVRGAIDCIIAQTAIAANARLLSPDRDFAAIARHTQLRLCDV